MDEAKVEVVAGVVSASFVGFECVVAGAGYILIERFQFQILAETPRELRPMKSLVD